VTFVEIPHVDILDNLKHCRQRATPEHTSREHRLRVTPIHRG